MHFGNVPYNVILPVCIWLCLGVTSALKFSKVCFEKDMLCYYHSDQMISFTGVHVLTYLCPKGTWLVTVFNEVVQRHLEELMRRFQSIHDGHFKVYTSMEVIGSTPHWTFGKNSRVPVAYSNWIIDSEKISNNECVFVSDLFKTKWQISSCAGISLVVCMAKQCTWTWEEVEGSTMNFENGKRFPGIANLADCRSYCEMMESDCAGVYMSVWNQCWLFATADVQNVGGEIQRLHFKSSKNYCQIGIQDLPESREKRDAAEENSTGENKSVMTGEKEASDSIDEESTDENPPFFDQAAGVNIAGDAGEWDEEPSEENESYCALERLIQMMNLMTGGIVLALIILWIVTLLFKRLTAKKKEDQDLDQD